MKPEIFSQMLSEIFEDQKRFCFEEVYCFNYHGDPVHIRSIINAVEKTNKEHDMKIKYVMEDMDLMDIVVTGEEDFLHVFSPKNDPDWFSEMGASEKVLDIHAGAFETGILAHICPKQVDLKKADSLKDRSLSYEQLELWLKGGESAKGAAPFGYAGNPNGYEAVMKIASEILIIQVQAICEDMR